MIRTLIFALSLATAPTLFAQTDTPETLRWAERQANRADSLLESAIRSHDALTLLTALMESYTLFDAVTLAGLYCTDARVAAHEGRYQCDVVNFRLEKDLNMVLIRAITARRAADQLRTAARRCDQQNTNTPSDVVPEFAPTDLIRQDAQLIEMDLTDGLASENFHILAQKIEHATRLLHDIEHLAGTLDDCAEVKKLANSSVAACDRALAARNWTEVKAALDEALTNVRNIAFSKRCQ
jgi:hypothetical protein